MSQRKYEKITKRGYAMLKLVAPPKGFHDVHLTISVDKGDRVDVDDLAWKLPHFTMIKMDWMGSSTAAKAYLLEGPNGYELVTKDRTAFANPDPDFEALIRQMLTDGAVNRALQNQERFVLYGYE
jgi:hypothetical protein